MFVQIIGIVAAAIFTFSFQIRSKRMLLIAQFVADVLFCIQFYLLGGISGCYGMILNCIRNLLLAFWGDKSAMKWKGWVVIFSCLAVLIAAFSWEGPISLLPLVSNVACYIGYWSGSSRNIRLANLFVACPCWLTYDIITGSIGGMLNESISLVSIIISLIRFGWKALDDADQKETAPGSAGEE